MEITREVAVIVLTNANGQVLMQHRTEDAHVDPGRWTPPGGRLEPGETPLLAAQRELYEETGLAAYLKAGQVVERIASDGAGVRYHIFSGTTEAEQHDVVMGEGQAMVFLTRAEITTKPLTGIAQTIFGTR
ncbi:NUDIX domain-containing protein [Longispora albida]|uniref:NUDIX domain-containing protein n=1 Tax=Longispora albida TaxID=203523 RepID=UPI00035CD447|nr:NUDIX domain-containing protein [Longispora albida]